jgi:uncharacterized membrane protein
MTEHVPPASTGASSPGEPTPPHRPAAPEEPTPPPPDPAPSRPGAPAWSRWNRPFLIGVAAGLAVVVLVVASGISGDLFGGGADGPGFFFFPFAGSLVMLLPLAIVVGGIWLLVTGLSRGNRFQGTTTGPVTDPGTVPAPGTDSAFDILRQRYARGEISDEEYTRMAEVLKRG